MKAAMSSVNSPADAGVTAPGAGPIAILLRIDRHLRWRRDRQRLQAMPDYLLDDIGLTRDGLD